MSQNYSNIVAGEDSCYKKLYERYRNLYIEAINDSPAEKAIEQFVDEHANITENGTYNITDEASFEVNVAGGATEPITITGTVLAPFGTFTSGEQAGEPVSIEFVQEALVNAAHLQSSLLYYTRPTEEQTIREWANISVNANSMFITGIDVPSTSISEATGISIGYRLHYTDTTEEELAFTLREAYYITQGMIIDLTSPQSPFDLSQIPVTMTYIYHPFDND